MNVDIREALSDAERALAAGDRTAAARAYVEAGDHAVRYQLWRSAARSFRCALELDLVAREVVAKLVALRHLRAVADWLDYQDALEAHPDWPHVSCLRAQVLIDDGGAYVDGNRPTVWLDELGDWEPPDRIGVCNHHRPSRCDVPVTRCYRVSPGMVIARGPAP